jgi:hypothetical protein
MRDLEKERYFIDMETSGRRLTKKADLVKRWTEAYPQQLRPKLLFARYSSNNADWWKEADLEHFGVYWGGEECLGSSTGRSCD